MSYWGRDHLQRWPEKAIVGWDIPLSSKRFLVDVGLPIREDWTLAFEVEADRPSGLPHERRLHRIGSDGDGIAPIYLDEDRNGCVIVGEIQIDGMGWFTNSSVEQFGECLLYYQQYRQAVSTILDEDDALKPH